MPYGVRLQAAEWEAIRRSYEYDPDEPTPWEAARRAAEKHGFQLPSRQTIYNRQTAEKWERHSGLAGVVQAAHRKADRLVESDGTPTPPPPPPPPPPDTPAPKLDRLTESYQARQDAEDKRAEVLARHRQEWRQVAVLRQEALQLRQSEPSKADQRMRLAKTTAETTKLQQEGERKAWGLDEPPPLPDVTKLTDEQLKALARGKIPGAN